MSISKSTTQVAAGWALVALLAALLTLDDPGLTVDEPINTTVGVSLAEVVLTKPHRLAEAATVQKLWGTANDHPPLARLWLGLCHEGMRTGPGRLAAPAPRLARPASALAYGLLVLTVGLAAGRLAGVVAAHAAAGACLFMPRLFAHAHFASPEMIHALFVLWAVLAAGAAFAQPGWRGVTLAGVAMGLALLTKLTAVLVPLAVIPMVLWTYRLRGVGPLLLWGVVAWVVVIGGWPWLWPFDLPGYAPGWAGTAERVLRFLGRASDRATLYTRYFGQQYADKAVPWHYASFYFAVTVPVLLHSLGLVGVRRLLSAQPPHAAPFAARLLLAFVATTLAFFTLPIHRYDGERLFLLVFPVWAVVIGVGGSAVWDGVQQRWPGWWSGAALAALFASQGWGVVALHPVQLSYHNLLVGGLPGAAALDLDLNYWGDAATPELLDAWAAAAEPGAQAVLLPTLFAGHAYWQGTSATAAKQLQVVPASDPLPATVGWALVFRRPSYLGGPAAAEAQAWPVVAEVSRQGVWLARLHRRPPAMAPADVPRERIPEND